MPIGRLYEKNSFPFLEVPVRKKMLSLQGLAAVLLFTSVSALSANPMLEERDLTETSDYGVMVGGCIESSRQQDFKDQTAATGTFELVRRSSAVASVGFSAFGRVLLCVHVGTNQTEGLLANMNLAMKNQLHFQTKPALVWGGKIGVTFYSENCVRACGFVSYHQSSMQVRSMKGTVARRKFLLAPSLDTAGKRKGLLLVPEEASADYTLPTGVTLEDAFLAFMPNVIYDPQATLEYSQYELGVKFAYGQQNMMYVGAKVVGGTTTFTSEMANITNYAGQMIEAPVIDAYLGTTGVKKIEGTRSSYVAPMVGFVVADKWSQLDICVTLLAQQDVTARASVCF